MNSRTSKYSPVVRWIYCSIIYNCDCQLNIMKLDEQITMIKPLILPHVNITVWGVVRHFSYPVTFLEKYLEPGKISWHFHLKSENYRLCSVLYIYCNVKHGICILRNLCHPLNKWFIIKIACVYIISKLLTKI